MLYLFILLIIVVIFVVIFNLILKKYHKVQEAFSTMDVYLKKRYDLVPNLVSCVKGYSEHEAQVLEKVLHIRSNVSLENIDGVIVAFESYPKLKADSIFINLQKNLNNIEEQISAARRNYNACVNDYNSFIQCFPINIIAKLFRFKKASLFSITDLEKEVVDINV